jgi:hypothetical protein
MFWHGHVKKEEMMNAFADAVCDMLGKGIGHLLTNHGNPQATPPPAYKKQRTSTEAGTGVIKE